MFRDKTFYHQHIRKAIVAFGSIFNGIYIERKNANSETVKRMKVPLSYGPKNKQIARLNDIDNLENGRTPFEIGLPRIGFEITGMVHDRDRQLPVTQRVLSVRSDNGISRSFISTPYNLDIMLSVFAKNQSDGFQVVEQILPYFAPDFNITVFEIPELGVQRDIQIVLSNVTYTADYESGFEKRNSIIYDMNFIMKINMFGFVDSAEVIKKTIISIYSDPALIAGVTPGNTLSGERITTTPDPLNADPNSDYSYVQEFDNIFAGEVI